MKWHGTIRDNLFSEPLLNDTRVRRRFLFFPRTLEGTTRWLERAVWLERYESIDFYSIAYGWNAERWLD